MRTSKNIAAVWAGVAAVLAQAAQSPSAHGSRPNIVVILVDDMGFSDVGCYGSEIPTPCVDKLAAGGLRFTQFYNTARCCPTRAALLTGLYSHQAGMGHMTEDRGAPGYRGRLNDRCVTIAEVLRQSGYFTAMTGKWHVGQNLPWHAGQEFGVVPWQRGFQRCLNSPAGGFYYGGGQWRQVFLNGRLLADDDPALPRGWYSTDLWTDYGIKFIDEAIAAKKPFFLYLAHNAPHFPLQAPLEEIAKFRGRYKAGWDKLRAERHAKQISLGIVDPAWALSPRPPEVLAWDRLTAEEQDRFDHIMAIYAAVVAHVDTCVGRLVEALRDRGVLDNTLLLFLSDNGANAESGPNGRLEGKLPGSSQSEVFEGQSWATLSNTPLRRYKHFDHEGGISTPLVVHWPAQIKTSGELRQQPGHVVDIMATCVDVAGAKYPAQFNGQAIPPMEGKSLVPTFDNRPIERDALYWEHEGNAAIRVGDWKLVRLGRGGPWELYDLRKDRTEQHDLAAAEPRRVAGLAAKWDAWAQRTFVKPYPTDAADWKATLTVTRQRLCRGQISPCQCGQFIEYLCALTPSMFAEKVFDGSFEGVPPYRVEFRKETDRIEQPWYPDGAVHRGEFTLDDADPFNGKVSQRIRQKPGDPCTLGISQGGMYVKAGEPLRCSLYLRADGLEHPVGVALWGLGMTYAAAEFRPGPRWQRYEATLVPTGTDARTTLTISYRGPGTLWIDQVSLMPLDTVFGWRRDVAEAVKALRPGIIRFGGSTIEGFDWKATLGEPAKRVPFTTCWGGLEPGNAGLEEFVELCRWAGAEPLICVRFSGKTPKDAANEVQYFNGPASSPMGKLRAANGHAEPYRVKYWQIGNELGDERYQKGLAEFCKAMKAVDPTIKLMAAFPSPGLLQNAGALVDYICPHHYGCHNLKAMEASVESCRKLIAQNAPGREIRLGITEWNTTAGDFRLGRAMLWTLDNALCCSRYHNFMHRHCDLIEIANRSNLTDSFCSGILQTNNCSLFKTPTYYAQQLYALHAGRYPLSLRSDFDYGADRPLDASATLSADEQRVSLFVVNPSRQPQKWKIDLTALAPLADEVSVSTLADTAGAGERDASNSWREPDRIRVEPGKAAAAGGKLVHEFPALSLTVLEAHRRGSGGP